MLPLSGRKRNHTCCGQFQSSFALRGRWDQMWNRLFRPQKPFYSGNLIRNRISRTLRPFRERDDSV